MENQRTLQDILSLKSGKLLDSDTIFQYQEEREDEIFQLRTKIEEQIQNDVIDYVCLFCKQPVTIRGRKNLQKRTTHFYLQHLYRSDDCIIKSNSKLTEEEVRRIKYNGVKESDLHNELKNEIAYYLGLHENTSVIVDKVYKDKGISKKWRKPDVLVTLPDKEIAFELQLSTTFLSVIVGRTIFYKRNGIFLIWIFNEFSLDNDLQKFTQKDVYYNNNFNVYVFDELAKAESIQAKELVLRCYYKKYSTINNELIECWVDEFIKLSDLKFDKESLNLYYYDSVEEKSRELSLIKENRREELELEQSKLRKEEVEKALDILRQLYTRGYLLSGQKNFMDNIRTDADIEILNNELQFSKDKDFVVANLFFDDNKVNFLSFICNEDKILVNTSFLFNNGDTILDRIMSFNESKFKRYATYLFRKGYVMQNSDKLRLDAITKDNISKEDLMKSIFIYYLSLINKENATKLIFIDERILNPLLSLKKGFVIGSGFNSLLQVCNNTLEYRKSFGELFIRAMKVYKRYDKLLDDDKKGSLKSKLTNYYKEDAIQDYQFNGIIYSIFPELKSN